MGLTSRESSVAARQPVWLFVCSKSRLIDDYEFHQRVGAFDLEGVKKRLQQLALGQDVQGRPIKGAEVSYDAFIAPRLLKDLEKKEQEQVSDMDSR